MAVDEQDPNKEEEEDGFDECKWLLRDIQKDSRSLTICRVSRCSHRSRRSPRDLNEPYAGRDWERALSAGDGEPHDHRQHPSQGARGTSAFFIKVILVCEILLKNRNWFSGIYWLKLWFLDDFDILEKLILFSY